MLWMSVDEEQLSLILKPSKIFLITPTTVDESLDSSIKVNGPAIGHKLAETNFLALDSDLVE